MGVCVWVGGGGAAGVGSEVHATVAQNARGCCGRSVGSVVNTGQLVVSVSCRLNHRTPCWQLCVRARYARGGACRHPCSAASAASHTVRPPWWLLLTYIHHHRHERVNILKSPHHTTNK